MSHIRNIVDITRERLHAKQERQVTLAADSVTAGRRREHWDRIVATARDMRAQLEFPDLTAIKPPCDSFAAMPTRLQADGWINRISILNSQSAVLLAIEEVDQLNAGCLIDHMRAESDGFDIEGWRDPACTIMEGVHRIAWEITDRYAAYTGLPVLDSAEPGLSPQLGYYQLGASLGIVTYQHVASDFAVDPSPLASSSALHQFHPSGYSGIVLALGSGKQMEACRVLSGELEQWLSRDRRVRQLSSTIEGLLPCIERLRHRLLLAIERGTFTGSCAVCAPWHV
jgi:hypothetical protein